MLKTLKSVFLDREIRNRILFVIFILTITRILSIIPIPSINATDIASYVSSNQFLGFLNIFAGGGLATLSIVMLGVQPYITASIIMQLMTIIFPKLKVMYQEEGDAGRKRFSQYTRYLTVPLAVLQAFGILSLFVKQGIIHSVTPTSMAFNVLIVTAGSILMMFLGEMINERGVGNGTSLIIFAGIVAALPSKFMSLVSTVPSSQYPIYAALLLAFVLILMAIVAVTEAERPLPVAYAKHSRGFADNSNELVTTYLPIRLTMAGVVPVIFAISFLLMPQLAAQLLATSSNAVAILVATKISAFLGNTWIYAIVYFLLIVMFTFFYTIVTFDPKKTAENLSKGGAFVPGHRPGDSTENYISGTLTRVTTIGALFLASVAVLPIILQGITGIASFSIGGTSLLIAVSVVIDLMKKIGAQMTLREY
jgi:preprotein translocase subunit SecY